jgi:transposase
MSRDEIRGVYRQGEDAVVTLIETLIERINALERDVATLKAQVAKNSHNSSKPPSSDMHRAPRSLRVVGDKPSGGQSGHEGHALKQRANPDHIVKHKVQGMCQCGRHAGRGRAVGCERRQVFDLPPPPQLEVTEHQAEILECACGRLHVAAFPEGVNAPVQYGERIKATTTYLSSYQLLPQKRTTEAMDDLFGVPLSQGAISNFQRQAYQRLEATENATKEAIRSSPVMHVDETGMYVGGKRLWQHTFGTSIFTFYLCHPKRGGEATRDADMLQGYAGRAIHDAWQPYFDFDILHGLCNAHHLRELVFVKEELGQRWAGTLIELLCRIKAAVDRGKTAGRCALAPATLLRYRGRYEHILRCGYRANPDNAPSRKPGQRGRRKQSPARNLLDRLTGHADEALAFMYDFRVPFDNNLAERDLRMSKVKQKISGCFRSMIGAQAFCRIRGYISTARKHGSNVLDSLHKCFDPANQQAVLIET